MLTTRTIAALKTDRRIDVPDGKIPGLALRVTPSGSKSWALRYRRTGGRADPSRRVTLGSYPTISLADARQTATDILRRVEAGENPTPTPTPASTLDTVADLAADYLRRYAQVKKRSWKQDDRILRADILPAWGTRKVTAITRRDVRDLIDSIADRGAPIMANRTLALIRKLLNYAIGRDWIESNVAALIESPGVERSRDRVLDDEEIRKVWAATDAERPIVGALTKLRLTLAQRGGELAKLTWSDVSDDAITFPGSITKNKKTHRIPLTTLASEILTMIPRVEGNRHVFPGRGTASISTDAVKKAGHRVGQRVLAMLQEVDDTITSFDFRSHDLRRTAATRMAEAGVPKLDVSRVLNHAEAGPSATDVYIRYEFDKEKRIALETWSRILQGILRSEPRSDVHAFARVKQQ